MMTRPKLLPILSALITAAPGLGCPGDGIMFRIDPRQFNLGDIETGQQRTFEVSATATNNFWQGVSFRITGGGAMNFLNVRAENFTPGSEQGFRLRLDYVPTGTGAQTASANITAVCAPNFPGNTVSLGFTYNGTAMAMPTYSQNRAAMPGGDPVSLATGEYFGHDEEADLDLEGPLPLEFRRYYASGLRSSGVRSALGNNWTHNFDYSMEVQGNTATVRLFRGQRVAFSRSGTAWTLGAAERQGHQLLSEGTGFRFVHVGSDRIYSFNATGALTRIEDRNGNTLTVEQASGGVGPSEVRDGLGRTLSFSYVAGKLSRVRDNAGREVSFAYTGDDLTAATDPNGKRSTYAYTTAGNLVGQMTAETRPQGNRPVTQQYSAQGRVTQQTRGTGGVTQFSYGTSPASPTTNAAPMGVNIVATHDAALNLVRLTDANGQAVTKTFDARNRLSAVSDRLGNRVTVRYQEPSGQVAGWTDEAGQSVNIGFENQTQAGATFQVPVRLTRPDGGTFLLGYDSRGNLTSALEPGGASWRATYDTRGWPETATNPLGGVLRFTRANDGTLSAIEMGNGETVRLSYDAQRRLTRVEHADATARRIEYNARNQVTRVTDERDSVASFEYDDNNELRSYTDFGGGVVRFTANEDDHVTSIADPLGKVTHYAWDAVGRLESVTGPAGNRLSFGYDTLNRRTSLRDASGKGINYEYDRENRLLSATDAMSRTWRMTRDAKGRVTRISSPLNEAMSLEYDAMGRISRWSDPLNRSATFTYDARGWLTRSVTPGALSVSTERNALGQPIRITDPAGRIWRWNYDGYARLSSQSDPLGRATNFRYNSRHQLARIEHPLGNLVLTRDPAGNLTAAEHSDGTAFRFTYDRNNRLTGADGIRLARNLAGKITDSNGLGIERDDAGRIAAIAYAVGRTLRYTYL